MRYTGRDIKLWARMGESSLLGLALYEMAQKDDKLVCVTADMARPFAMERFMKAFPERFFNVGIAEENLIGVASGLAKEGFHVFAFAQACFITARAWDFIKVNLGYMGLPVKLVGLSAGLELGTYGATHISESDIAQMRTIAGMTVVAPADGLEKWKALEQIAEYAHPVYLRLSGGSKIVYGQDCDFKLGRAIPLRYGDDVAIIATGTMVAQGLAAASLLEQQNISARVVDMHTIKPLDTAALDECLPARLIVTVEEHGTIGGLGSAVAEYLSARKVHPAQLSLGLPDRYLHAGEYDWLLAQAGLTPQAICTQIVNRLECL